MGLRLAPAIVLSLVLASACRTGDPAPSPASPGDPSEKLSKAWTASRNGDVEGALRLFRELDALGWDVPPRASDFASLSGDAEWAEIARRIAAREPRTPASEVAVTLAEPGLVAEGIAGDPRDGTLFVGSIQRRKIVRVDPTGTARDFVTEGLGEVLGLKVDVSRSLLWAVSNPGEAGADGGDARSALHAFDLRAGTPRSTTVVGGARHLLNDLALAPDGSVFVTDSRAGVVYRLPAGGATLVAVPGAAFHSPNGIAFSEGVLLVCDDWGLWALRPEGGPPRQLLAPRHFPLGGIDGLSARGRTLVAVQNGLGATRLLRLELTGAAGAVRATEILETANPLWRIPTTGTLLGDHFLYIGNSGLDARHGDVLGPEGLVPTRVHRLHVPL